MIEKNFRVLRATKPENIIIKRIQNKENKGGGACIRELITGFIIHLHFVEYKNKAQNEYKYHAVFVLQRTG